jgi:hypothetical protein
MNLTWRQKTILAGVLRDQRAIAAMDYHGGDNLPYMVKGNYRLRIHRAQAGYVPIDVENWLGAPPTNSETVMFHREYGRLEKMGLLERHNWAGGRRTTHLRLTEEGAKIAEGLLAEESPMATNEPLDIGDLELMPIDWPLEPETQTTAQTDATAAP